MKFNIHPDITESSTMPASFYKSGAYFEESKEKIFAKSWQFVGDAELVKTSTQTHPLTLLENFLDEPVLLTRDSEDVIHCLSNVCTHRANLVVDNPGKEKQLRCRYHGRRFDLNGKFLSMPEFKEAKNFPSDCDDLPKIPFDLWNDKFLFVSPSPAFALQEAIQEMKTRLHWLPLQEFKLDMGKSRDYLVKAHWALYCDNYLEGFHIPFVHPGLNDILDYDDYACETYRYSNLQIGYAKGSDFAFELPELSIDYGKQIAAYYYWVFPNMMFNFYPWGLSVNIVKPVSVNLTRVSFLSYVYDESKLAMYAINMIDRTEREDEEVVESVQRGLKSRFYTAGRYSPKRESCVHHFHRLIQEMME